MKILFYIVIFFAFISALYLTYKGYDYVIDSGPTACTMEAMMCPDGTTVGRTGPNCSFAECPTPPEDIPDTPEDILAHIESKAEFIRVDTPEPYELVESPVTISGEARGYWFFEASFPVVLVDWDGEIIAEGIATAGGDWMTEEFVPFTATLSFEVPELGVDGTLIFKKDNPSGLPENDDALEIPVQYAEEDLQVI